MPLAAFWTLFTTVVLKLVEPVVSRVIGAIGFGMIAYSGLNVLISTLESYMATNIGSFSANVYAILSLTGFGHCITVIMSAISIRAYLSGMNSAGTMLRSTWVNK